MEATRGTPNEPTREYNHLGLANSQLDRSKRQKLCMRGGCAYKGTLVCLVCPFADSVKAVCSYGCTTCEVREGCPCGVDGQEQEVRDSMGGEAVDEILDNNAVWEIIFDD